MAALAELFRLDLAGEHVARVLRQLGGWLAGPSESVLAAPLNAAALFVLARVTGWRAADPWLRLLAAATLAQHAVLLFYATAGRYAYVTWLLTLIVVAAWLQDDAVPRLHRRHPALARRIRAHPASIMLARVLARTAKAAA